MTDIDQATFDAGVASGILTGGLVDGTIGDYTPDEVFKLATDAVANPETLSLMTGIDPSDIGVVDPVAMREVVMQMYDSQRAVDSLARAHESAQAMRDETIARRHDSMMRHAKVDPEQMARVEFDRNMGDPTPMNKIREKYFFE